MSDEDFVETDGEPMGDDESHVGSLTATLREATSGSTAEAASRTPPAAKQTSSDDFDPRSTLYRGEELETDDDENPFEEDQVDPLVRAKSTPKEDATRENPKQPPAPTPNTDGPVDVFAEAQALGLDLRGKFKSQREAIKGLVNAQRLVGQRNEAAQMWDSLRSDPEFQQQVYQRLHSQYGAPPPVVSPQPQQSAPPPPAAAPQQQAPAAPKVSPPKWNPAWAHHFNSDGTPKPNADPNVIVAVEEFRADRRLLQEDPAAYFAKYFTGDIEERAQKAAEERLKQAEESRRQEEEKRQQELAQRQQFEQVRTTTISRMQGEGWFDWIYEPGYQVINGEVIGSLSDRGQLFNQYLAEAAQAVEHGVPLYPHPMQRANYARQRVIDALSQSGYPQPGQQGQAHAHDDTRMDRTPGGNVGTAVKPGDYPKGMSLAQKLAHDLRASGIANT
jgi:hypothetical protein